MEQPGIPYHFRWYGCTKALESGVALIYEHVASDARCDYGRDDENHGPLFIVPSIAERAGCGGFFVRPSGEFVRVEFFDADIRRDSDLNPGMGARNGSDAGVDKNFEQGSGERVGGVDDAAAWRVPPASV